MVGKILIKGYIGRAKNEISLQNIASQVAAQPNAAAFNVLIDSGGGDFFEGIEIYEFLKRVDEFAPITTIGLDLVASIATPIFLAAKPENRILTKGGTFMIHLPSGGIEGSSRDLAAYAEMISSCEKQLLDIYVKETGGNLQAIEVLMVAETFLDASTAQSIGFANKIINRVDARI